MTAVVAEQRLAEPEKPVGAPAVPVAEDRTRAQFARFVLVGGSANVVYACAFLLLADLGTQVAHLAGAALSTVLANELHRRLTFRAGARTGWLAAQWAGGGLAVAGMAASSIALASLSGWSAAAGPVASLLVIGAVNAAVGVLRFAGLRWALSR